MADPIRRYFKYFNILCFKDLDIRNAFGGLFLARPNFWCPMVPKKYFKRNQN